MKVRATTSFFQKIQNPIKSQIGHQLSWKQWRLKVCNCFTGVPNFILISQAVYKLSGFQTLKIGHIRTHAHTHAYMHIHTYIRTPAKNHISRRFRLFWVLWHWYFEKKNFHENIASSVRKQNEKNCRLWIQH